MKKRSGIFDLDPVRDCIDDVYKKLLQSRKVYLFGNINNTNIFQVTTEIEALNLASSEPIELYINSPGGEVYAGSAVIDAIKLSRAPVLTIAQGHAMSMAAFILAAGDHRVITPHSTVMIHQVSAGEWGKTEDMDISVKEMKRIEDHLLKTLAKDTGTRLSKIKKDIKGDFYMSAQDAVKYGIVDEILR